MDNKHVTAAATWPGAFSVLESVARKVRKNPKPFIIMAILYGLGGTANALMVFRNPNSNAGFELIAGLILMVALPRYALALADNKMISFSKAIKANAGLYLSVLAVSILYVLLIGVSLLLLVIPVIWAVGLFSLVTYPVAEGKTKVTEAFRYSKRLSRGHMGKVWGLVGASFLLTLISIPLSLIPVVGPVLSALAAGVVGILFSAAAASLYRWLQQHRD